MQAVRREFVHVQPTPVQQTKVCASLLDSWFPPDEPRAYRAHVYKVALCCRRRRGETRPARNGTAAALARAACTRSRSSASTASNAPPFRSCRLAHCAARRAARARRVRRQQHGSAIASRRRARRTFTSVVANARLARAPDDGHFSNRRPTTSATPPARSRARPRRAPDGRTGRGRHARARIMRLTASQSQTGSQTVRPPAKLFDILIQRSARGRSGADTAGAWRRTQTTGARPRACASTPPARNSVRRETELLLKTGCRPRAHTTDRAPST